MYSRLSAAVLRFARVPPQPEPPLGEAGSIRTFRAGRNYYYLKLLGWGAGQFGAVIGIVFSIEFTTWLAKEFDRARAPRTSVSAAPSPQSASASPVAEVSPSSSPSVVLALDDKAPTPTPSPKARGKRNRSGFDASRLRAIIERMPRGWAEFVARWFIPFLVFLEYLGILTFLVQFPATYALVRIEFEQHWYIVTDRSLRIRTGLLSLSESTMSFANLQQVEVKQGPLQRLLGVADVRVRSAGGGGDSSETEGAPLHTGVFHSVDNADEIRDLILARLRTFREAGLGDPDHAEERSPGGPERIGAEVLDAAREVLQKTRALREAATRTS